MFFFLKTFFHFDWRELILHGFALNIFFLGLILIFLCKIALPNGIPILLMFFILRDNIGKFLADDFLSGNCQLLMMTVGNMSKFLIYKMLSFLFSYGMLICLFSFATHYAIYSPSMNLYLLFIIYCLTFLILFLILALCSILTVFHEQSYLLINLIFAPFVLPIFLLTVLFFEAKVQFLTIFLTDIFVICAVFFLLQISFKNALENY